MSGRQHILFWTGLVIVFFLLLYLLRAILLPFIAGMALAYFLDPAADKLETWKIPRAGATSILLILFFAFVIGLFILVVPLIQDQFGMIADNLPDYASRLITSIKSVGNGRLAQMLNLDPNAIQNAVQKSGAAECRRRHQACRPAPQRRRGGVRRLVDPVDHAGRVVFLAPGLGRHGRAHR